MVSCIFKQQVMEGKYSFIMQNGATYVGGSRTMILDNNTYATSSD